MKAGFTFLTVVFFVLAAIVGLTGKMDEEEYRRQSKTWLRISSTFVALGTLTDFIACIL